MRSNILIATLAAGAAAAPGLQTAEYVNTFSNVTQNIPFPGVRAATIPGLWQALSWTNMYIQGFCDATCTIFYHSPPYGGQFAGGNVGGDAAAPATISAAYTGSKVASFNLESLYLGCGGYGTYGSFSLPFPVRCNVTFNGYRLDAGLPLSNVPAATVTFAYTPVVGSGYYGQPTAQEQLFTFPPTFVGLRRVEAVLTNYAVTDPQETLTSRPTVYIDDVKYRVTNISLTK